uniref:Uncharacterized protein n=1 Tax=Rhipicephalus zambeziensis TaxID=60191 RepID=A0A224YAC6_9ACAR
MSAYTNYCNINLYTNYITLKTRVYLHKYKIGFPQLFFFHFGWVSRLFTITFASQRARSGYAPAVFRCQNRRGTSWLQAAHIGRV